MPYQIAVIGTAFDSAQIQRIRAAAEACGCRISFYPNHDEAIPHLHGTDILFGPSDARSPELIRAAGNLKWFASYYAGVDPLLASGVMGEDMILTNGSGAYGVTIAEHMIMVCLMMMRRYPEYREYVSRKEFYSDLMIHSLYDSTVLICGTGDIGAQFARRLRAFCPAAIIGANRTGRQVEGFDRVIPMEQIDEVLPQVDLLALTLPGTPLTDNLICRERLASMKSTAYLVNVGRGNCLDQDALIQALNSGALAGAALDVFRTEPIPQDDPAWNTKNLLVTPHCSGKMTMQYTRDVLVDSFCDNLVRFCEGKPMRHVVDKQLGY